jgi:hypothetical protein
MSNSISTCSPFSFLWTGVALPEDMSWPARCALLWLTYFTPRRGSNSTAGFAYTVASSIVSLAPARAPTLRSSGLVNANYHKISPTLQAVAAHVWQQLRYVLQPSKYLQTDLRVNRLLMHQQNNGLHTFYVCACKQTSTPECLHCP